MSNEEQMEIDSLISHYTHQIIFYKEDDPIRRRKDLGNWKAKLRDAIYGTIYAANESDPHTNKLVEELGYQDLNSEPF